MWLGAQWTQKPGDLKMKQAEEVVERYNDTVDSDVSLQEYEKVKQR